MENNTEKSFALEILHDYKKQNKRLFIIWIITFLALIGLSCYTIYLINDIGVVEEETITQDSENGNNNYIGNDGEINNGKTND